MYFSFDIKELDVWSAMSVLAIIISSRKCASKMRESSFSWGRQVSGRAGRHNGSANKSAICRGLLDVMTAVEMDDDLLILINHSGMQR